MTKAQVVVVTVKGTDNLSIEKYANGLFSQWGIGEKKEDNGVLILFDTVSRKSRIEVGYGLEGALSIASNGK